MIFAAVALAVLVADRLTKFAVEQTIALDHEVTVIDHLLWIQHLQNSCGAFSSCLAANGVYLAISIVVAIALAFYEWGHLGPPWVHPMLGLVMGGVLGNGVDRLIHGGVTDLIALHWWPTFNLADSAISIGVVALALGYARRRA